MDNQQIEQKTARLYEDIHPYVDIEYAISNYLNTLGITEDYFAGKDILDCGFGGTGWAIELFARAGANSVSGIDLNAKWAETITANASKHECKIDLRQGNVLSLPFNDQSFDYVHSYGVMHHTADWKKGVAEMARVLKPAGTMYLMLYGKFALTGKIIHGLYRISGKVIPYGITSRIVKKTGFFRHSEVSLLDAMYVPIEEHLSEKEIYDHLSSLGLTDIRFFESHKWKNK